MTPPGPIAPLSILVVDDEEPVREVVAWMLQDAGHAVHAAADGHEALAFLDGNGPVDIVISDINMPGIDGLELSIRARGRWPNLPFLLISGRPPPNGARPFLPKPFRFDTLLAAINAIAGAARWNPQALAGAGPFQPQGAAD